MGTRTSRVSAAGALAVLAAAAGWVAGVGAQTAAPVPEVFRGADLALGAKLIEEGDCDECHARRVGGDGKAIYRPQGRINTPEALLRMVDYCSLELKLKWFPEEVQAVAAVLQRDHYRFGAARAASAPR